MANSIDTDLNVSPYFDDFDFEKGYNRILFKPSVPVQARELTQLQSTLQKQVEIFGQNILKDGAIVSGCTLTKVYLQYVKVKDRNVAGDVFTISDYANGYLVFTDSDDLTFQIQTTQSGFETQNPNLNTFYGKYTSTGRDSGGTEKEKFAAGNILKFYPANGTINSVSISNSGTGYTNGDLLVFTSERGTNAAANVTTDASGNITSVTITNAGKNYDFKESIAVTVNTSTGSGANLSAVLLSNTSFTVANSSLEKADPGTQNLLTGTGPTDAAVEQFQRFKVVGDTIGVKITNGVIFQKGHFIDVDPHLALVDKYTLRANNYLGGFVTSETIVSSNEDSTLLDNAQGFNNVNAPGADRLKLTPTLTFKTDADAVTTNNFFRIVKIDQFRNFIFLQEDSAYSQIGREMAKRTKEESGDYVVKPFEFSTEAITSNTTHDRLLLGTGTAYVSGFRNQTVGTSRIDIRKGLDTANVENAVVSQDFGNYIEIDEYMGAWNFANGGEVKLIDTAANRITTAETATNPTLPTLSSSTVSGSGPSYTGTVIGTAKIRSFRYDSGVQGTASCKFRLYVFDVRMDAGKEFKNVRAIGEFNSGTGAGEALADVVLNTNSDAEIKQTDQKITVKQFSNKGIKTLNHKPTDNASYTFRTLSTSQTVATNGTIEFSLSGGDQVFPYTVGSLTTDEENEFIVVANASSSAQTVPLTGTVQTNSDNTSILGSGTAFLTEYSPGDTFIANTVSGSQEITGITNNTFMTVRSAPAANSTGQAHRRLLPGGKVVPLADFTTSNIAVTGTGNSIRLNVTRGKALEDTLTVDITHNVKKNNAQQINKNLNSAVYVKINCNTNAATSVGPWSLGVPDVYSISKVYVHTTFTGIEAAAYDQTNEFVLDRRQQDGYYDLSYLRLKKSSSLSLTSASRILVVFKAFSKSGSGYGYFTVDSYPVDDSTDPLPADKIRTESIPVFTSPTSGKVFDLRDSVDFRPYASNTANVTEATSASAATTNPNTALTFASENYFASPGKTLEVDYQHYLPRKDVLSLSKDGQFSVSEGKSNTNPVEGIPQSENMPICSIDVPVFPSLVASVARNAGRMDYGYKVTNKQIRRYTMKDINQIKQDVSKLQYYTSLNNLEKDALSLTIPSSANTSLDRFKNGIIVDNFSTKSAASVIDREFKAGYDTARKVMTARTRQNRVDIKPVTFTNTSIKNDLITITYDDVETDIKQKSATQTRNAAEASWQFIGKAKLLPDYDNFYDVRHPAENNIKAEFDLSGGVKSLIDGLNDIEAIQSPSFDVISSESVTNFLGTTSTSQVVGVSMQSVSGGTNIVEQVETTTVDNFETITTSEVAERHNQFIGTEVQNTVDVGTFVKDIAFNPYIREQDVHVHMVGLKPNTRHYAYFDQKDISAKCTPMTVNSGDDVIVANFRNTGALGDNLVTSSTGELFFKFRIDPKTYPVGQRELAVFNKSTFANAKDADSSGTAQFNAFNHSVEKSSVEITTKQLEVARKRPIVATEVVTESSTSGVPVVTSSSRVAGFIADPPPPLAQNFISESDGDGGDDGDGDDGDGDGDPLAQTFIVKEQQTVPGIFVSKIDVFFQTKDPNLGITMEIRRTTNGYPTTEVLPYSRKTLKPADVSTSDKGTAATTFTFDNPVFLRNNQEYCVVLTPVAANPNYEVFVRKAGQADLSTQLIENKDSFTGSLFVSSNNRAWKPTVDEDMKMTVYRANFNSGKGDVVYQNADYEFFDLTSINSDFEQGERVFKWDVSANLTGTVQFSTTSETLTGNNTLFTSELSVGDYIALSNGTTHDTKQVTAIASNTSLTMRGFPSFTAESSDTANVMFTPQGTVEFYENKSTNKEMYLVDVTSTNSTFAFANNDVIIGGRTQANASLSEVKNLKTSGFENLIYTFSPSGTEFEQFIQANTLTSVSANTSAVIDNRVRLPEERYIKSRSNEIIDQSGAKSWKHDYVFRTRSRYVSPVLDDSSTSILRLQHLINNDTTNEYLPGEGNAEAKYISKVVTLDQGLDAEDIKVFVTSTRPQGTDVQVYARILNEYDYEAFIDKHWTKLTRVGDDSFTSPQGLNDFIEMEFGFPSAPLSVTKLTATGLADVSNTIISTNGTDVSGTATAGKLLKIVNSNRDNDYQVERIAASNTTTITVDNAIAFDNVESELFIVDTSALQTGFLDPQNEKIVTYFNNDTVRFSTYKSFQIKIVLTSSDITRVPRVKNYRAIAVTV